MIEVPETARCWAEIDGAILRANVAALRAVSGPGVAVMAVVKADGYGHGAKRVCEALTGAVEFFGVAQLAEAISISDVVRPGRIMILSCALPAEREEIVRQGWVPWISSMEEAIGYESVAAKLGKIARVHLKIDTGMGRLGLSREAAANVAPFVVQSRWLQLTGVATHLPVADEDEDFTRAQLAEADRIFDGLSLPGTGLWRHSANSAGAIGFSGSCGNLIRAGLGIYGCSPRPEFDGKLRGALTWKARVTAVREIPAGHGVSYGREWIAPAATRVAVLAVGYADGFQRHLSASGAEVLLHRKRCPLVGRVTMDQIMVDVTGLPQTEPGDVVTLLGRDGAEEITAVELAARAGTIPWEIFTGIGGRVGRFYKNLQTQPDESAFGISDASL